MNAKYTLTFCVLAGLCATAAWHAPHLLLKASAAWAGLSYALAAAAYAGAGPRLLLKRPDGTYGPAAWLLHGPYFATNLLLAAVKGRLSRDAARHEILPGLWLGRRLTAGQARRLPGGPPDAVLDLTAELPEPPPMRGARAYLLLPLLDAAAPTPEQLDRAVQWIDRQRQAGSVYVHCAVGRGRSACAVAAYLIAAGHAEAIPDALAFLRARGRDVRLEPRQAAALRRWLEDRAQPPSVGPGGLS